MKQAAMVDVSYKYEVRLVDAGTGELVNHVHSTDPLEVLIETPIAHSSQMAPTPCTPGFYKLVNDECEIVDGTHVTTLTVRCMDEQPAPARFPKMRFHDEMLKIYQKEKLLHASVRKGERGPIEWHFCIGRQEYGRQLVRANDTMGSVCRAAFKAVEQGVRQSKR